MERITSRAAYLLWAFHSGLRGCTLKDTFKAYISACLGVLAVIFIVEKVDGHGFANAHCAQITVCSMLTFAFTICVIAHNYVVLCVLSGTSACLALADAGSGLHLIVPVCVSTPLVLLACLGLFIIPLACVVLLPAGSESRLTRTRRVLGVVLRNIQPAEPWCVVVNPSEEHGGSLPVSPAVLVLSCGSGQVWPWQLNTLEEQLAGAFALLKGQRESMSQVRVIVVRGSTDRGDAYEARLSAVAEHLRREGVRRENVRVLEGQLPPVLAEYAGTLVVGRRSAGARTRARAHARACAAAPDGLREGVDRAWDEASPLWNYH